MVHEIEPDEVSVWRIVKGGLEPAQLVLTPDGRIRELRLDGAAISRDFPAPGQTTLLDELYPKTHATTLTLRLIDTGAPVTIRPPDPGRLVPQPVPQIKGWNPRYGQWELR